MSHVLLTNDFPPKRGGIQAYLWELWRRLDPDRYKVVTASSDPGQQAFDVEQAALGMRIHRVPVPLLLPTPRVVREARDAARSVGAELVVVDPALPVGLAAPTIGLPYAVVLHGAEVTVPGRLPVSRQLLAHVLGQASLVVSAGGYPAAEAVRAAGTRLPPVVEVPPGVDCEQFTPHGIAARRRTRRRLGLPEHGPLVVSVSRLVPRKGMDVLVEVADRLRPSFPDLCVAIGGRGRLEGRLERRVEATGAPVRLLGTLTEADKVDLLAAADVFVMACRDCWLGLEQEGFGIVFLEAAAAGVPQVAGRSGGAEEAVVDGETGFVVDHPEDVGAVAQAVRRLLADEALRRRFGAQARVRAEQSFDYAVLAPRLGRALAELGG